MTTAPILPFPLTWPRSMRRTSRFDRRRSQFGADHAGSVSPAAARNFLLDELARLGAESIMITTNLPCSSPPSARPSVPVREVIVSSVPPDVIGDPGAAAWFVLHGEQRVIACDRWLTTAENLHALGLTIQAMRGLDRWGAAEVVELAMAGFALPDGSGSNAATESGLSPRELYRVQSFPDGAARAVPAATSPRGRGPLDWRTILRVMPGDDLATVKRSYRRLMSELHGDKSGTDALAKRLNMAMEAAARELGTEDSGVGSKQVLP